LTYVIYGTQDLTSEGAIAMAEILPEMKSSLVHLDLTDNLIDIAGVLALSVAIRLNKTIRCLDLNIPVSLFILAVAISRSNFSIFSSSKSAE
jgi:hypothetical protein